MSKRMYRILESDTPQSLATSYANKGGDWQDLKTSNKSFMTTNAGMLYPWNPGMQIVIPEAWKHIPFTDVYSP